MDAFRAMARIMGAYKGRKNLIWISESFAVDTMPDMQPRRGPMSMDSYSREIEQMSDSLMEAQIAIILLTLPGFPAAASLPYCITSLNIVRCGRWRSALAARHS
jgi:hypothetical protein